MRIAENVLSHPQFVRANPGYTRLNPCVYVGMTGLNPEQRFLNHKNGHKHNYYAKRYGKWLLEALFSELNPMPYFNAKNEEVQRAQTLRCQGYAVWQN